MGNTAQANFSTTTSWIGTGSLTQVFTGTITWSSGSWVEITLTTPFTWTGSNLVVAVDENAASYSYPVNFNYTAGAANSSISYYSDGTNPNPATPPTANTRNTYLPNIQLVASNPCPTTPTVTASVSSPVCPGDDINLTCTTSSDPLTSTYLWSGPDGFSSTDQNPTISGATAAKAGVYTVVVTEPVNGCTATAFTSSLVVKTAPTIDAVSATPSLICPGASTTLNVYPSSPTLSYCNSNFTSASYEFITNVSFDAINNSSAGAIGAPSDYTAQVANVAVGTPTTLSVTIDPDANDYVYAWIDWDQNGVLNDAGETYTLATATSLAGPHTLAITPPLSALNGSTRMRVMVDYAGSTPNPCRSATWGEAEDYTINVTGGVAANTYSWDDGSGVVATTQSFTASPTATTTYTVTVTNGSGCDSTMSKTITVNALPSITTQPADQTVCEGQPLSMNIVTDATSIQWLQNGTPISGANAATYSVAAAVATDAGNYTVALSNDAGCVDTSAVAVVAINTGIVISATTSDNTGCGAGDTPNGTLTITSTPALTPGDTYDVNYDGSGVWSSIVVNAAGELVITGLTDTTYSNIGLTAVGPTTSCPPTNTIASTTIGGCPLAITMGDIKATNIGAANRVDWNTKKEEAGDRFVIERSADAHNFTAIGTTDAKGISDSRYSFIDAEPFMGINYYRLLILNNNGSQYYTKVVNATVKGQGLQLEAFPNPVREVLTVRVNGKVTGNGEVSLLDASGRTLAKASIEANGTATFNMQHLAQGMYLVKFTDNATTQTLKVTKD